MIDCGDTWEERKDDICVDNLTGEVVVKSHVKIRSRKKVEDEPEYIKVYKYINALFAFKGINQALVPAIIEIANYMDFADEDQLVILNKRRKENICKKLDIGIARLTNIITELKKSDILRPTGTRGEYAINPYVCAKGTWSDIKTLQMKFDACTGDMTVIANVEDRINGAEVKQVISNNINKNLSDQKKIDMLLEKL